MAKGYWITLYRSAPDATALKAYGALAGPAIESGGGKFIVRGTATKAFERGMAERSVVIEFESVQKALATYNGPAYQAALKHLAGVDRDVRIVEGV